MKLAKLGSVSTGTLRTEDLLSCFICELEWMMLINGDYFSKPENFTHRDRLNNLIGSSQDLFSDDGETEDVSDEGCVSDMLNALQDALNEFAPPYCSFGAHPGDGSDFGFWPDWFAIEELPQVDDNSDEAIEAEQSPDYSTDVRYVNDHGNTTVYGADGSVLLELV